MHPSTQILETDVKAAMTGDSSLASSLYGEDSEWFDIVNAVSLALAAVSGTPLLAIIVDGLLR
jgi:hypothetical protein